MLRRLKRLVAKPPGERANSVRFVIRRSLAKLPYALIPVRIPLSATEAVTLWWSYIGAPFDPTRSFLDYWGQDVAELRFLWNFLRPGMAFLDGGAYHGLYTLSAAKRMGRLGRIIAFEPSGRERRRLQLHLRLNRLSYVELSRYALGAAEGTRKFFVVDVGDTTMNSFQPPAAAGSYRETLVETVTLDGYCRRNSVSDLDLMKVDVEGAELDAFQGAEDVFQSQRPLLICEVLDVVTQPWGYHARNIIASLQGRDYAWFDFRPGGTLVPHVPREHYPEVRNYLAVPREKLGLVQCWTSN